MGRFLNVYVYSMVATFVACVYLSAIDLHMILKSERQKQLINEELLKQKSLILKEQFAPHFVFNSLAVLSQMIDDDIESAHLYIDKLSELYRYIVQKFDNDLNTIKDESYLINKNNTAKFNSWRKQSK